MKLTPLQETLPSPSDTTWAGVEVPTQETTGLERTFVADDKIYVVMGVVLIIWFGLMFLVFRTDRRLRNMERTLDESISQER